MKRLIILLFTFLMLVSCRTVDATTLNFNPSLQEVFIGDIVEVDLYIYGLGHQEAPSIGAFSLDILWDPRKLRLSSVILGDQLDLLGTGSWTSIIPKGLGSVGIYEVSFGSIDCINANQLDEFSLATLTFDAILIGSSLLGTTSEVFGLADGTSYTIDIIEMGRINIVEANPVPISSTILLLCSGLMGAFFFRRKM